MDHRHVLPGNLLTGPAIKTEDGMHKHHIVGGDGFTSESMEGPGHRHRANGQGTSGPMPLDEKQKLDDTGMRPANVKQVK